MLSSDAADAGLLYPPEVFIFIMRGLKDFTYSPSCSLSGEAVGGSLQVNIQLLN